MEMTANSESIARATASETAGSADVTHTFLGCLEGARHERVPYDYWLTENALPDGYCDAIANLPFAPPGGSLFNGTREANNSSRVYFTPGNQQQFEVCRHVADGFQSPAVRAAIEEETGADLSDGHLRIEYCQDTDGFWLEPHTDIVVKKFTMLVYLSDDPELAEAGTNILEGPPDHKFVGSAPYGKNKGVIFIPGENTWHGVAPRTFRGIRKSIIVNYVTSDWNDKWELA
jgi:hypothetical protein